MSAFVLCRLPASFLTYAILGSYNAQADLGDFDPAEHGGTAVSGGGTMRSDGSTGDEAALAYLRDMPFAPQALQTAELLERIAEMHKSNKCALPASARLCPPRDAQLLSAPSSCLKPLQGDKCTRISHYICMRTAAEYLKWLDLNAQKAAL